MVDLNKAKPGQKLRLRNGDVVEYSHYQPNQGILIWPHKIKDRGDGNSTSYRSDGSWGAEIGINEEWDIIEIIMETKPQRIAKVEASLQRIREDSEAQLKQAQDELRAIREEPDTPPVELKDKHVYRREDGSVVFVFKRAFGDFAARLSTPDDSTYTYLKNGSPHFDSNESIVECIGKIGVVSKDAGLEYGSNAKGTYATPITYDPNTLTGEKIS